MGKSVRGRVALLLGVVLLQFGCQEGSKSSFEGSPIGTLVLDSSRLRISVMAENLEVPWDLHLGPGNKLWYTEQKGTVTYLDLGTGEKSLLLTLEDVHYQKSRGLLSLSLHPDFENSPTVFLHYNYLKIALADTLIKSRVVAYRFDSQNEKLDFDTILLDEIPGQTYHNGSRMIISPDNKLLMTMGDAGKKMNSQDPGSLSGKLLRMNLDGSIPDDNPYPDSYAYANGVRNSQGLTYGPNGQLYCSDHGPNNDDEVNILREKRNYGWPLVEGYCNTESEVKICNELEITEPIHAWTPTIAPAGIAYYNSDQIPEWKNSLLLGALKAQFLSVLSLNESGEEVVEQRIYLQKVLGRIRDVVVSSSGNIFISTSNHDWHPKSQPWMYDSFPTPKDDRIIMITKVEANHESLGVPVFGEVTLVDEFPSASTMQSGQEIYTRNCTSCHLDKGQGVAGLFPPLANTDWVTGDRERLIRAVLEGISGEIEVNGKKYHQEMPGFKSLLSDQDVA
ncbi:MAG: PQQ-dependent sugar dehydrogenase, partial [Cyclobacteriaceae bacterium]